MKSSGRGATVDPTSVLGECVAVLLPVRVADLSNVNVPTSATTLPEALINLYCI